MKLKYQHLKALLHQKRELFSDATQLRIHRGLSWLHAAETTPDLDTQFILLWVAFNSIYAKERDEQNITGERKLLEQFLGRLIRLDQKDQILIPRTSVVLSEVFVIPVLKASSL